MSSTDTTLSASAQGTLSSPLVAIKPRDAFTVAERGFWQGTGHHAFDPPLAQAIVSFFLSENVSSTINNAFKIKCVSV